MKVTDLFVASAKYAYSRYFLTHLAFSLPYNLIITLMDEPHSYPLVKALGYTSIVLWFLYGLNTTRQHRFVIACGALFLASQAAYYAGEHTWDLILTLTCVALALVKLYVSRYQTYDYVKFLETGQYAVLPVKASNTTRYQIYSRKFGKLGFRWHLTDLNAICKVSHPAFFTIEEAQKVINILLKGTVTNQK